MIVKDKPSIEEVMAHHGVPGMKWGHTTGESGSGGSGGGSKKKVKPTTQDIYNARFRTQARISKIQRAQENQALATSDKGRAAAQRTIDMHVKADAKDAKVGAKLTTGEKFGNAFLIAGSGLLLVSTIAAAKM